MKRMNTLGSLVLLAAMTAGAGCVVRAHGRVGVPVAVVEVDEEPPPPRVYISDTRPGFIFIQGRWTRQNRQWVWRDGYWERQRAGHVWDEGRWERRGRGHVYVEGRWRAGGGGPRNDGPQVRDHRGDAPPPPPPSGPVVRDHR